MYLIPIDKIDIFEASIHVDGIDYSKLNCRLVLESSNKAIPSFIFNGEVINSKCKISIPKLKSFIGEGLTGTMRLEVIADDMFFTPWSDSFETKVDKKVTVESIQNDSTPNKPIITVETKTKNISPDIKILFEAKIDKIIQENNISLHNLKSNIGLIKSSVQKLLEESRFKDLKYNNVEITSIFIEKIKLWNK